MRDYRSSITDRARIVGIELTEDELEKLNARVNRDVAHGSHHFDALDMVYFHLVNKRDSKQNQ